jgi:predicted  nucleic acid-binding Zn-ribbon protein
MSASLGLFRLQQVDNRIHLIESRLAQVQATLANDVELQNALGQLEAAQARERELEASLHESEQETQAQKIKIEQADSSLYSGGIHNPKELQDLQKDVASLKKHLAVLEERQLESMLESEAAQKVSGRAQQELEVIQARLGEEHRGLIAERSTLVHDLDRLESERQAAVSAVASGMLDLYERLRQERRGVAVAEVLDGSCAACGTTLTAAHHQSARQGTQLVHCPSCGRILFAG